MILTAFRHPSLITPHRADLGSLAAEERGWQGSHWLKRADNPTSKGARSLNQVPESIVTLSVGDLSLQK